MQLYTLDYNKDEPTAVEVVKEGPKTYILKRWGFNTRARKDVRGELATAAGAVAQGGGDTYFLTPEAALNYGIVLAKSGVERSTEHLERAKQRLVVLNEKLAEIL